MELPLAAWQTSGGSRLSKEFAVNQPIDQQRNVKRTLLIVAAIFVVGLAAVIVVPILFSADKNPADKNPADKNPVVEMDTSMGKVKIELFADQAPITVKNFLSYVDDKFYDGLTFHRVIPTFMIQGGGFEPGLKDAKSDKEMKKFEKKTKDPIKNEASNGVSNVRGTLAMARTDDPNSATAQFFINVKDNGEGLDYRKGVSDGYCVFGKVIDGMDVVDKIKGVETKTLFRGVKDVPVEDVIIKSIRRVEQ
jgi:cyclophilin family peptidyl-prolyl cis-trans isomerase